MLRQFIFPAAWVLSCLFLMACSDPVVYDNHGKSVQLSQLKGKWVVVNYWADWCPACQAEVQELNHFHANSVNKDYLLYGVDVDKFAAEEQDEAIKKAGILFPVLRENPGPYWGLSTVTAIPTTFIINPDGRVVQTLYGPYTEQKLLHAIHVLKTS